jgi:hypothetical protein
MGTPRLWDVHFQIGAVSTGTSGLAAEGVPIIPSMVVTVICFRIEPDGGWGYEGVCQAVGQVCCPAAMANKRSHRSKPRSGSGPSGKNSAEDVAIIRGDFADYLRARHYAPLTIERCQRHLTRIAEWLRKHPKQPALNGLTRSMVPRLLVQVLPGRSLETRMNCRKAVFHWLRFKGRFSELVTRPWAPWLRDYLQFLPTHQGVGRATLELNEACAKAFREWQFGTGRANWSRVQPTDIWRFASRYVRGVKPVTGKSRLGYVRRFLNFVH